MQVMKKGLVVAALVVLSVCGTTSLKAQVREGVPIEKTPVLNVKKVPQKVQKEFTERVEGSGLQVTGTPKWTRQNGLYVATFTATGPEGPGSGRIRLKPYGGVVLYEFTPDNAAADARKEQ